MKLPSLTARQQSGQNAERQAVEYLTARGLRLLEKNFRSRWGEIDLIMQDDDSLVFVEVRYRQQQYFGDAMTSIDSHKQQRLIKTAQLYLQRQPKEYSARFDVIAIDAQRIEWLPNAFDAV